MRLAGARDLILLHDFEQRALHLGRGTVDLVGEQQVGEYRPQRGAEVAGILIVDPGADEIDRHQIGGKLDAPEVATDRVCECLHGQRLRGSGHAFDQQMALRQHRH